MKMVTPNEVQIFAKKLNVSACMEIKGGKPEWTLTSHSGKVAVIKSNASALSTLQLIADLADNRTAGSANANKFVPKVQEKVFKNPKATTRVMMATVDHPDWPLEQVIDSVKADGFTVSSNVASVVYYDARKTMAYINRS